VPIGIGGTALVASASLLPLLWNARRARRG